WLAMVLTLILPIRAVLGLGHVITRRHIDNLNKLLLLTPFFVGYGYLQEHSFAWYAASPFGRAARAWLATGTYAPLFWLQIACNVVAPQVMWFARCRTNPWVTFLVALMVGVGMWVERFTIIVVPLTRDFLPSSWGLYMPTWVDVSLFAGTLGLFGLLYLLFLKLVPPVPIFESQELQREERA